MENFSIPDGFVRYTATETNIKIQLRYFGEHNFMGRSAAGYFRDDVLILTKRAAEQLLKAQEEFIKDGYTLVVYDAYRPNKAVQAFIEWAKDTNDIKMKKEFYPYIEKQNIHTSGYLAKKSAHSRGSVVDISLAAVGKMFHPPVVQYRTLSNGRTIPFYDDGSLDMGSSFDLFDVVSWVTNKDIEPAHYENRMYLQRKMIKFGFDIYEKEWWHFALKDEQFPHTYFNFDVK